MLYILSSFKKEVDYLLDIVNIVKKKKADKKVFYRCRLDGREFYIVRGGMGKKSIPATKKNFENCSFILSTGFCGALIAELANGDLVISEEIMTTDEENYNLIIRGQEFDGNKLRAEKIELKENMMNNFQSELSEDGFELNLVKSFTSPKIVKNKTQRININKATGAQVVDMEDIYRLDFADSLGVGFLSIRVVLDEITDDIPGFADGFRMGHKLMGILSKMDRASQSIAVAVDKFIRIVGE